MKFAATAFLTALSLIGAVSARASVDLWTGSGCSGTKTTVQIDGCVGVHGLASAEQNKGDNGIKYTCDGYSDKDCTTKVGEVYDCLTGSIAAIECYENPPL